MGPLQAILRVSSEYPDAEEVHCFASEKKSALQNNQRQSQNVRDHGTAEGEEECELIKVPMCFTHRENNL
jgi:hypothetical protein